MAIDQPGIYRARPLSPKATVCQASTGTYQVAAEFEILSQGYEGERIWWYGFLTDKAMKNAVKGLRNCGWTGSKWDEPIELDTNAEVDLDIQNEEWEGKSKLKVAWVNKPGENGGAPVPLEPAQLKAFAARMNGYLLAQGGAPKPASKPAPKSPPRASNPPPAAQQTKTEQIGVQADDIPF